MSLPSFSVRRRVTTFMIYLGVMLLGAIAWSRLPQELYPPITYPQLTVVTRYKDAAPEEIEVLVTKIVEEAVGTVSGLKRLSSISKEEVSLVIAEFDWDTNMDFASLGVREKLDLIKERLPRGSEEPVVIKFNPFDLPVIVLNFSGELSPHELLEVARKQIKNELEKVEGVAAVKISGGLEREILVEVDQARLQAARLPIAQVTDALAKANMNYPAGTIKEAFYEYLIRTMGEFKVVSEMPGIAVGVDERKDVQAEREAERKLSRPTPLEREKGVGPEQRVILLRDVATVRDTFKEVSSISRFNGRENISVSLQKQAGANTVQVADRIRKQMEEILPMLPAGTRLTIAYDQSTLVRDSIAGVTSAAAQGGVLAFIVLLLFLGHLGDALNVALAIPISILATMSLMFFTGTTFNTLSLGGLAFGLGLLVDCGIIVVENIARLREEGVPGERAAVKGTEEMSKEIVGSEITNLVVFFPLVFVVGLVGQFMKDFALTVILCNVAGLFIALTLTALLGSIMPRKRWFRSPIEPFLRKSREWNGRLVAWFLDRAPLGMAVVFALFALSVGLLVNLDQELMPRVDQGQFIMRTNLPTGTRLEVTDQVVRRIENVLRATPEVQDVAVTIGSSKEKRAEELLDTLGSHQGQILVRLKPRRRGWGRPAEPERFRTRKTPDVVQGIKETLGHERLQGAEVEYILDESVFKAAFTGGAPVVVEVKGGDLAKLEKLTLQAQELLKGVPGLYGVQTSIIPPSPETKVHVLKDKAATYHLSVSDVALTAQTAIKGFVGTKFKEEGKEVDIRVRLRKQDREDISRVRRLLVHSPLDVDVPLSEVAYFAIGTGPTEIRHLDQQRTFLVSAQLFGRPLNDAFEEVTRRLPEMRTPTGYTVKLTGESEKMRESFQSVAFAVILSVVLVYMVMASSFESLWQPFLIMASIPMSVIGVALILWLTGTPVSVMVGIGFLVLGGIVVDNGIAMIEAVNRLRGRRPDIDLKEALVEASMSRFRPILMTAATTVLGVLPLALGLGQGVELQGPMAITTIGGLIAATFLSLVFLPSLFYLGAQFFERFRRAPAQVPGLEPALAGAGTEQQGAPDDWQAVSGPSAGIRHWVPHKEEPPPPAEPPPDLEERPEEPPPGDFPLPEEEAREKGPPAPEAPEVPEIPEGFGGEEAVPDKPESGLFPPRPSMAPPEPSEEQPPAVQTGSELNSRQQILLEHLKTHPRITRKEYVELTGASVPTAARDLKELADRGLIRGFGPLARGRYYVLA